VVGSWRNLGIRESVWLNRELGADMDLHKELTLEMVKALPDAVTKRRIQPRVNLTFVSTLESVRAAALLSGWIL